MNAEMLEKVQSYSGSPNDDFLSGSERLQATAILSHAESALSNSLNFESTSLRLSLRKDILDSIRILRVVLAPQKRLPPELLTEIFVLASHRSGNWLHNNYPLRLRLDTTKPPWVFGQVCARWRHISRSQTHSLWRDLHLGVRPNNEDIVFWLCSALPRDVHLSIVFDVSSRCSIATKLAVCNRVQAVSITLSPKGYDELWGAIPVEQGSFGLLEHGMFTVVGSDDEENTPTVSTVSADAVDPFIAAASLKSLRLRSSGCTASCLSLLTVRFPWPQLTTLDIAHMWLDVDYVLPILEKCTSLEKLFLKISLNFGRNDTATPPLEPCFGIQQLANLTILDLQFVLTRDSVDLYNFLALFPSLKTLKLTEYSRLPLADGNETNSLKPITFPNLKTLRLEGISHLWLFRVLAFPTLHQLEVFEVFRGLLDLSLITQMLERSSCPLSILTIYGSSIRPRTHRANLPSLLKAVPLNGVVECTLAEMVVPDALIRDMARGDLLPRLVYLLITPEKLLGFVDMVESRMRREVQEEGGLRLRCAWANGHDDEVGEEELHAAHERIGLLTTHYGVDYRI
ncbi:hypothetical protein DXG03_004872 [Asterophora parasitica]|uniref:F-box domain-containing protein n=1 Tax=Asterophora parasitica TaxID=117018 RepID=A0A9P7KGZ5_9AGAR|nr:hypothetical protein DXG03_004872 [Asterophora parasitica]